MNKISRRVASYILAAAGAIASLTGCATTRSYKPTVRIAYEKNASDYVDRATRLLYGEASQKEQFDTAILADTLGNNDGTVQISEGKSLLKLISEGQLKEALSASDTL